MKTFLTCAVFAATVMLSIPGCKKTASPVEEIKPGDTTTTQYDYPPPTVSSKGMIAGKVMPETKFSMLLYNDTDSYEQFTIVNRTGVFVMTDIKAGDYTLVIQPADPAYNAVQLEKIRVDTGRTTNLGLIFLP